MMHALTSTFRIAVVYQLLAGLLLLVMASACGGAEGTGPSTQTLEPTDSTAAIPNDSSAVPTDSTAIPPADSSAGPPADSSATPPTDSTATTPEDSSGISTAILDTRSRLPGIVFASNNMSSTYFNSIHTGAKRGGITPENVISVLTDARARGARLVLKFSLPDPYIQNSDGTFNFTKWKDLVNRYRNVDLNTFIADGTLLGHFLIDEPHMADKWGGKIVPQATVEAMAQHSKQIWPYVNTLVHTKMTWLASTSVTYHYLDAGWVQYASSKGPVSTWASTEISNAKAKGLGLVMGLNILNGGNGSSGIRGTKSGKYSMSGSELRSYGTTILDLTYACAFVMWEHKPTYYDRTEIASAMSALSLKAKAHVKTSCRQ
jgi:hypothetical protein